MSIVLVCGGRDFNDHEFLNRFMDREHHVYCITHVIHGGCKGADTLAHNWAMSRGIQPVRCDANWTLQGAKAGPIRNKAMLALRPDWGYAFPGGKGTAGMVKLMTDADIDVFIADPSLNGSAKP